MIEEERRGIERGEGVGNAISDKHGSWQEKAKEEGRRKLKLLSDRNDAVEYACQRPQISCREVQQKGRWNLSDSIFRTISVLLDFISSSIGYHNPTSLVNFNITNIL